MCAGLGRVTHSGGNNLRSQAASDHTEDSFCYTGNFSSHSQIFMIGFSVFLLCILLKNKNAFHILGTH